MSRRFVYTINRTVGIDLELKLSVWHFNDRVSRIGFLMTNISNEGNMFELSN